MRPFTTLIDAPTLARQLTRDDLVLFDCRSELGNPHWGEAQFSEAHIPGAQFLHLDRDLSGPITPMSGRPLYTAYGFVAAEELLVEGGGGPVPATRMVKPITPR